MNPKNMVTGQVVFRDAGNAPTNDGRRLMSFVGLIAIPDGFEFKGENQYVVTGNSDGVLMLHADTEIDVSDKSQGSNIGQLLTKPMWRC
jgi:hypothetical protein